MGSKNLSETQTELKFYTSLSGITETEQQQFNKLIVDHPSARKYLTYDEYAERFSVKSEEFTPLLEFAKKNQLEVDFDNLKREVRMKIPNTLLKKLNQPPTTETKTDGLLKSTTSDDDHRLLTIGNLGDLEITTNPSSQKLLTSNAPTKTTKHIGFTKLFEEKRPRLFKAMPRSMATKAGINPLDFAKLYNFPNADGIGECIGIIELGGTFNKNDLTNYFSALGLTIPEIEVVGEPAKTPENENIEVTADIQIAGSLAPKAKLVIYYGSSILDAVKNALSDKNNSPSVLSISWAGSEFKYSDSELNELNIACYEAALRGITIVAASGDYGAFNNMNYPNVNVPANLPFILGCGGTQVQIMNEKLIQNNIWNESNQSMPIATGGGFSQRIMSPVYSNNAVSRYLYSFPQYGAYNPYNGRPVPDVSANAADSSGYSILFNNQWMKLGGTSLSTPLWAALIARINQKLGYRLGFINNYLYNLESTPAFIQSVNGNNGFYLGAYGWNPCTGLGSPNGVELVNTIIKSEFKVN